MLGRSLHKFALLFPKFSLNLIMLLIKRSSPTCIHHRNSATTYTLQSSKLYDQTQTYFLIFSRHQTIIHSHKQESNQHQIYKRVGNLITSSVVFKNTKQINLQAPRCSAPIFFIIINFVLFFYLIVKCDELFVFIV